MGLLDLFFPRYCLGCRREGSYFCLKCRKTIKEASPHYSYFPPQYPLEGLVSLFAFDGIIKEAIHRLKYQYITDLWGEFFAIISRKLKNKEPELESFFQFIKEKPTVVPIPLHWHKLNVRGFNQASLFGKSIAQKYRLPYSEEILIRNKTTVSQTQLKGKEREKNIKNAFKVISNSSPTPNILLIDDVWTTGSTMNEAARVLKKSRVKRIWGLTIAK